MAIVTPDVNGSEGNWGAILNTALNDLQTQIAVNTTAISALASGGTGGGGGGDDTAAIADLDARLDTVETNATTLTGRVTTAETAATTLTGRVTTAENNATTLTGRVTATEGVANGAVAKSIATTKGDLFVATAASTITRHPAGISGRVLTADSTLTRGMVWSEPTGIHIAKLTQTTSQNIATASATSIIWDAAPTDRYAGWTSASPTRYTVQTGGVYEFDGAVNFASNATGYRMIQWFLNGAAVTGGGAIVSGPTATGSTTAFARNLWMALSAGDYLQLVVTQSSGTTLGTGTGSFAALMQIRWLAAS